MANSVFLNSNLVSSNEIVNADCKSDSNLTKMEEVSSTLWKGSQPTTSQIHSRLSIDDWGKALETQKKTNGFFSFSCSVGLPFIDWNARRPNNEPIWDDHFWLLEEMDLPKDWQKLNDSQLQVYLAAVLGNNKLSLEEFELIKSLGQGPLNNSKQIKLYKKACQIVDLKQVKLFRQSIEKSSWDRVRKSRMFDWNDLKVKPIDWKARQEKIKTVADEVWKDVVDYLTPDKVRERIAKPTLYISFFVLSKKVIPIPEIQFDERFQAEAFPQNWLVKVGNYFLLEKEDLPQGWQEFSSYRLQFYLAALLRNRELSVEEFEVLKLLESSDYKALYNLSDKQLETYNQINSAIPLGFVRVFDELMQSGEWENARKAILAHEFAHMTGSCDPYSTNMHMNRLFEKEADMIASLICKGKYAKALSLNFDLHAKYISGEMETVDIASQSEDDDHPTNKTRAEYILSFNRKEN